MQTIETKKVDVILFTGDQCSSCDSLKKKLKGNLTYEELNVEKEENIKEANRLGIKVRVLR